MNVLLIMKNVYMIFVDGLFSNFIQDINFRFRHLSMIWHFIYCIFSNRILIHLLPLNKISLRVKKMQIFERNSKLWWNRNLTKILNLTRKMSFVENRYRIIMYKWKTLSDVKTGWRYCEFNTQKDWYQILCDAMTPHSIGILFSIHNNEKLLRNSFW